MEININAIDRILAEDEYIEWLGKAEPFPLLHDGNKKRLYLRWASCAVVAVLLSLFYITNVLSRGVGIRVSAFVVILCVPVIMALKPIWDKRYLADNLIYVITNQRAIIYRDEKNQSSMSLDKLDGLWIHEKGDGVGDVAFGAAAVTAPAHKYFYYALSAKTKMVEEKEIVVAMAFYNVALVDRIRTLLETIGAQVITAYSSR